jgi:hypothetical protein
MEKLYVVLLARYYSGDPVKNTEMGCAWDTYGAEENCIQGFGAKP